MLDPTHGELGSPPPPRTPSATARFPPSLVSPPHPACTNTDIHNNTNELWLGLLFQSSFSVGREEVPLTEQMGYRCSARCCIKIDANRGWPLGQALCGARGRPAELFFCGGGAGEAASGSQLLTVTALLVAPPSKASLPLPLPLSLPTSLPLGESPMSDWGSPAGLDESSTPTTMRRCGFADRIGKMRYALPSPSGTCPGGTYSADESTCNGSGTTNTCWASYTIHTLPFLFALLYALASTLR